MLCHWNVMSLQYYALKYAMLRNVMSLQYYVTAILCHCNTMSLQYYALIYSMSLQCDITALLHCFPHDT